MRDPIIQDSWNNSAFPPTHPNQETPRHLARIRRWRIKRRAPGGRTARSRGGGRAGRLRQWRRRPRGVGGDGLRPEELEELVRDLGHRVCC